MRNELNRLVQTVSDPNAKRVCSTASYTPSLLTAFASKGVRHGDAALLLPLYALPQCEGLE